MATNKACNRRTAAAHFRNTPQKLRIQEYAFLRSTKHLQVSLALQKDFAKTRNKMHYKTEKNIKMHHQVTTNKKQQSTI